MVDHLSHYLNHCCPMVYTQHHTAPHPHHYVHVYVHPYHAPQHNGHLTALPQYTNYPTHVHAHAHPHEHMHGPSQYHHISHTVHITMYAHHIDTTKTVWIWHITNHRGELEKVTTKVHKTLIDCIESIDNHEIHTTHHQESDVSKTDWTWRISHHNGYPVRSSLKIHHSLSECLKELRINGYQTH